MADPISAAAAAFASWATAAFTTATGVTSLAAAQAVYAVAYASAYVAVTATVTVGLNAIARSQLPDVEGQKSSRRQARPVRVYALGGVSRMAGSFMLREAVGNKFGAVLAVSEGRLGSISKIYERDTILTVDSDGWVQGQANERYGAGDLLRVQTRLGLPTETPFTMLAADFGAYWQTSGAESARGDGVSSIGIWAQHRSREAFPRHFPNGIPEDITIAGTPVCYDWRDLSQDREDPSTWEECWNPIVWFVFIEWHRHGMKWERCIAPVLDALTEEADYCDEIVTRNGVTEPRYRCAGNYPYNLQPEAVRAQLLAVCDGWMSRDRGRLILKAGRYQEPTFVLTSEHIRGFSWRKGQTDEEAINALIVSYVDANQDFTEVEAGTLFDEADISARGVERPESLSLKWCPSATQGLECGRRKMTRLTAPSSGQVRSTIYGLNGLSERYIRVQNPELPSMADVVVEVMGVEIDAANASIVFDVIQADTQIDGGEAPAPTTPDIPRPPVTPGGQQPARTFINRSVTYPTSADDDSIAISAFGGVLSDGTSLSLPAGTITGLTASTFYGVFWRSSSGYAAFASPATAAMSSGSWIFIGWQSTSDSLGDYPTNPTPPGGWGGTGNGAETP